MAKFQVLKDLTSSSLQTFGTEEETSEISTHYGTGWVVKPRTYLKGKGLEERTIGPLTLPPGNYALRFGRFSGDMKASFSLKKTVSNKPYETLYASGLTLLQVGVPLLITGVISLSFGTLVS